MHSFQPLETLDSSVNEFVLGLILQNELICYHFFTETFDFHFHLKICNIFQFVYELIVELYYN